ncbi:MAG: glycosyltransferase family 4 protein [Marinicellaceae bacterium]
MKNILHISNWYPNKWNDIEAIFIKEQFTLFSEVTNSNLLHVEVRNDISTWFKYEKIKYSENETGFYIRTKIKSFRILEILTTFLLFWALRKTNYKKYDLLHFHISYPLLTYYHWFKKIIKTPIVISEHWSAFHFNFFMPKTTKKLNRIKNIFKQDIPLITVSKALLKDIQEFSGTFDIPSIIIPNVIDLSVYKYKPLEKKDQKPIFFIVNFWRDIKNPMPMLSAFAELSKNGIEYSLIIGGYGDYLDSMKSYVKELSIENHVDFVGKMNKQQIADQLIKSHAYLFSSSYETFSAVCAQALCCGCPLIGPAIPAILEYAGNKEMINLESNDKFGWIKAIEDFMRNSKSFNRHQIAMNAQENLSHQKIQKQYLSFIS